MDFLIMRAQMKNLARKYHAGQFRKGPGNIPYIVHPEAVVKTLLSWGTDTHRTLAIAWGHDLLEDTTVSDEEIIEAADEYVLKAIRILTCPEGMPKSAYLEKIVKHGNIQVLLVKIADRICNTKDFIKLKGKLYAYQYLHQVDPLIAALKTKKESFTTANALKAFEELDNELRPDAQREMIRGCLAGGAVGDALGSPIEFFSEEMIKKKYAGPVQEYVEFQDGTGAITDDTQMTLFTAEGILRAAVRHSEKGICAPEKVVQNAYMRWLKTQGYTPTASEETLNSGWLIKEKQLFVQRAPGMTCLNSLNDPAEDAKARNDSKGCGTVMRMAPAGLFFSPECAYHYGCLFSAITHGHPTGITAGGAFALLIAYLLEGESLEKSLDKTEKYLLNLPDAKETLTAIKNARRANSIQELGEGWVAEEALAIGIFCALKHTWDFKAGVIEAININGDSDSTGAITGNILGILNGENGIPQQWCQNLREYSLVSQIADDLIRKIEKNPEDHVTKEWWEKYPGF